jgi:hypothetical protein
MLVKYAQDHANDDAYGLAEGYAYFGQLEQAFAWLDRAYRQKDNTLYVIKGDPLLKNLRTEDRYQAFLRKMNFPE